jgi:hypothetical protein
VCVIIITYCFAPLAGIGACVRHGVPIVLEAPTDPSDDLSQVVTFLGGVYVFFFTSSLVPRAPPSPQPHWQLQLELEVEVSPPNDPAHHASDACAFSAPHTSRRLHWQIMMVHWQVPRSVR